MKNVTESPENSNKTNNQNDKMETKKHIGIWMDHSIAHLMEIKDKAITTTSIKSDFTHLQKQHSLSKSENLMHNKEQHEQAHYYKKISDALNNCESVLVFGPTTAKNELVNVLKADHHFNNLKIEVKDADKMTENQQHSFVKDHFNYL